MNENFAIHILALLPIHIGLALLLLKLLVNDYNTPHGIDTLVEELNMLCVLGTAIAVMLGFNEHSHVTYILGVGLFVGSRLLIRHLRARKVKLEELAALRTTTTTGSTGTPSP